MYCIAPLARFGGLRGLWEYLIARVNARKEIEKAGIELQKAHERSQAATSYIQQLPDCAELMDYEDEGGRKIWIRKNGASAVAPAPDPTAVFLIHPSVTNRLIPDGDQESAGQITP
jgi:hypothetical protein